MKQACKDNWLSAFNSGKECGFYHVFKTYNKDIRYFCKKLTNNDAEAEDITVITFQKLFERYDKFTSEANIKAFLYVTARNRSIDYLRKNKIQKTSSVDFSGIEIKEEGFKVYIKDTNSNEMIEARVLESVYAAIEELPDQSKRVFKMKYYEGLSYAAIASALSVTIETVRSIKRYAVEQLRVKLKDKVDKEQ